jgi:hypothetical protein
MMRRKLGLAAAVGLAIAALFLAFNLPQSAEPPIPAGVAIPLPEVAGDPPPAAPRAAALPANELLDKLRSNEESRWLDTWNGTLSRMSAAELWGLASESSLADQVQAKALREQLSRGCVVSSSEREFSKARPGLVDDWCKEFQPLGGTQFLRERFGELMNDPALLSANSHVLGPRHLKGTQAEKDEELRMLENAFRTASDPWTLQASVRSLWQYRSSTLLTDWSAVDALSRFQQGRLGYFLAAEVVCRSTGDCDAGSTWLVELCTAMPGLVCASGASVDALVAQNLSPTEATILRSAVAQTLAARRRP